MPYIGEVRPIAFTYAPFGWMFCQGQTLRITQYPDLFSLIGNTYGGDGRTTFCLPNLFQRVVVGMDGGEYSIGHTGGETMVTLQVSQLPPHSHGIRCITNGGTQESPSDLTFAKPKPSSNAYADAPTDTLNSETIGSDGNDLSHNNMQPFLTVNYVICYKGTFPNWSDQS